MLRFLTLGTFGLCGLIVGCSSNPPNDQQCAAKAAFQLSLSAYMSSLPADTSITVKYGGGEETYALSDPVHKEEAVLCDANRADADAGDVLGLVCALWTQGAATVTVKASGYPDMERALEAEAKNECIQTVPVDLVLGGEDAGTP